MNMQWVKTIGLAAALLFGAGAQAGLIVDTESVDTFISMGENAAWTHDLSEYGFVPGSAESATLNIELWDDGGFWDFGELASIIVGTIDFLDGAIFYTPNNDWSGSLGLNSLASLNSSGQLNVTVWSLLGDFGIGDSVLQVTTSTATSVPEPGSLVLFGLGLLGLGLLRRKTAV